MLKPAVSIVFGGVLCSSLLWFDHLLGNGFLNIIRTTYCRCFCFVKKTLSDYAKSPKVTESSDFNVLLLGLEMGALLCTMLLLNKYKNYVIRHTDEEKNTDEIPEKKQHQNTSRSMDGWSPEVLKPQLIQPLNVEVPVLHMAIIDTIGTTRSQPERGDAGDIYNITDSAILSVASLLDKDFKLPESIPEDCCMDLGESTVQLNNNRYLWDVMEED